MRTLYRRLREDGYAPWLDEEDLLPGENWREKIPSVVRRSDVVVVCLSRNTTKEGYVQKEIRVALEAADEKPEGVIFIIPLKIEECEVPHRLADWQWVNYYEENGYEKLTRALSWRVRTLPLAVSAKKVAPEKDQSVRIGPSGDRELEFLTCVAEYRRFQQLQESSERGEVDQRLAGGFGRIPVENLRTILLSSPNDQETAMAVAVALGVEEESDNLLTVVQLLSDLLRSRFERARYRATHSIRLRLSRGNVPASVAAFLGQALSEAVSKERATVVRQAMQRTLNLIEPDRTKRPEGIGFFE